MTFDNIWKAFQFVPGTAYARIVLVAWEAILGLIVWTAARWIESSWLSLLGFPVAFWAHEFLFRAWVRCVARIPDADDGDIVGFDFKAVLTLERWIGPVR